MKISEVSNADLLNTWFSTATNIGETSESARILRREIEKRMKLFDELLYPEDIDARLNWPLGKTKRMARKGKIPHIVLPDGDLRFRWREVEQLLCCRVK